MSALAEPQDLTLAAALAIVRDTKDKSFLDLPLGREVRRYLNAKRKELTAVSYRDYEGTLHKLVVAFGDLSLEDFELPRGADLIEPWMDDRWGHQSAAGYNTRHAHLRDFFRYCVRRQRMNSNPMELVGRARKRQPYRETFTQDEVLAVIAAASDPRDRIALRLLFDHGLRKGALQTVQFKHFDITRKQLVVFTKGEKVQPVPIPEGEFWTDLERHILEDEVEPDHFLMCIVRQIPRVGRRRYPDQMMTLTPLHNWWGRRLKDAGVRYRKMHAARHTFGQMVLDATGDLKLVQELLGHASVQTTGDIYTHYTVPQQAQRLLAVLPSREAVS